MYVCMRVCVCVCVHSHHTHIHTRSHTYTHTVASECIHEAIIMLTTLIFHMTPPNKYNTILSTICVCVCVGVCVCVFVHELCDIHIQTYTPQYIPELILLHRKEYNLAKRSQAYHHTLKWASQMMA